MLAETNGPVSLVSTTHACKNILCYTRYSIVQKLSNKQSAKVICKYDRRETAHSKTQIAIINSNGKLISRQHI